MAQENPPVHADPKIIDVRLETGTDSSSAATLRAAILSGLKRPAGQKTLPTLLLYDERGLRLYDAITTDADEYYLFPIEETILKEKGAEIIRVMHGERGVVEGEVVLELGAGALRKTSHILHNLASLVDDRNVTCNAVPPITYYALDLERRELLRTLSQITMDSPNGQQDGYGALGAELAGKISACGMWGTYDGGIQFINQGGLERLVSANRAEDAALDRGRTLGQTNTSLADQSPRSKRSVSNSDSPSRGTEMTPPSSLWSDTLAIGADPGVPSLHILFLGSSLGNFSRPGMATFLSKLPLRPGSGDTLVLGMDGDNDKDLVERAYNDSKGITRAFIMNGLRNAGRALGNESLFVESKWEYVGWYNEAERRHEAYYKSVGPQTVEIPAVEGESTNTILKFADGELVNIELSHKVSKEDMISLVSASNLREIQRWTDPQGLYNLLLLERPPFHFPLFPGSTAEACLNVPKDTPSYPPLPDLQHPRNPYNVPTVEEWGEMWKAWDFITLKMIPPSMLHEKPIDLRHKCLFYLGHIPAFLDIHLARLLKIPNLEPQSYCLIFERGIDPHVDDPTQCNPHSEVPEHDADWPSLENILDYRDRVRQRLLGVYRDFKSGKLVMNRKIARVLFMTYEHEGWHAETLLYMLIQRAGTGTIPPSLFARPAFDLLSLSWDSDYAAFKDSSLGSVVKLGPQSVVIGHNDFEADDLTVPWDPNYEFGWDNEHPQREVQVAEFKISWRPVTNEEFFTYWSDPNLNRGENKVTIPASWVQLDGRVCVRTLYGPVAFGIARHWPVQTSYDNLSTYARVKGGRIPTLAELRVFWETFQSGFVGGGNVGFKNWHPVPATTGMKDGGKGHNGGVWEWTSTKLNNHEGYTPSVLYPGYSMDFFDEKHHIVIGGSYVTMPRIAQRASVANFYQHNYPYAWVGARIAYDI